jgi:hypothetical protein
VQPLFDGPLDIVGDIHGEIGALRDLLGHLGYDPLRGEHPSGRRLAFIGDLCDRGEDSPGVVNFARELVGRGLAQCLLGNHELNVLRGAEKDGNGWFFDRDHDAEEGRFTTARRATAADRGRTLDFFAGLPLALERSDLRLVHAAWDGDAIAAVRAATEGTVALYSRHRAAVDQRVKDSGLAAAAGSDYRRHGARLKDPSVRPPLLTDLARLDETQQNENPVRVVTSGPERVAREPFFASGKWRMLDRVRWWHDYRDAPAVVVGHYWRWATPAARDEFSRGERDLFDGLDVADWHGARRNVYCVDFGVGARYREREQGHSAWQTRLGALRWPEREVVFDDGARVATR